MTDDQQKPQVYAAIPVPNPTHKAMPFEFYVALVGALRHKELTVSDRMDLLKVLENQEHMPGVIIQSPEEQTGGSPEEKKQAARDALKGALEKTGAIKPGEKPKIVPPEEMPDVKKELADQGKIGTRGEEALKE